MALVFFFSGFSALLYQLVWQRLLTIYYGVGAISISLIVTVFLAGLGFGALLGGWLTEKTTEKISLYAMIEFLVGLFGVYSLAILDWIGVRTMANSHFISLISMAAFLLIPTVLMGATLPILTKIYNESASDYGKTVSRLYFINTLGAAIGSAFGTYIIISMFGLDVTLRIAAAINFSLSICVFLSRIYMRKKPVKPIRIDSNNSPQKISIVHLIVMVTGFIAIAYEILWFRMIEVGLKADSYSFSTILTVYLVGIALGSQSAYLFLGRVKSPTSLWTFLGGTQFLIGAYVLISTILFFYGAHGVFGIRTICDLSFGLRPNYIPNWLMWLNKFNFVSIFWPIFFIFIPTFFMGATFPLVAVLGYDNSGQEGDAIGHIYFSVILGNIFGGLVTGFVLLPFLGTEVSLKLLVCLGLLFGFLCRFKNQSIYKPFIKTTFVIGLIIITLLYLPSKGSLYIAMHPTPTKKQNVYVEEGLDGVVVTYVDRNTVSNFINGMAHGGRPVYKFCVEAIKTLNSSTNCENILVIGYGTGMLTETILKSSRVKNVTIVELNHTLMKNLKKIDFLYKPLMDPRTHLIMDDGRRYLNRASDKFNIVMMDPLRSKTAYSNNLYSRQFFQLAKSHLSPGGIIMVWLDEKKIIPNTLARVFNHVAIYDFFGLASQQPIRDNPEMEKGFMEKFSVEYQRNINQIMSAVNKSWSVQTFNENVPINDDWKPFCEYYRKPAIPWLRIFLITVKILSPLDSSNYYFN